VAFQEAATMSIQAFRKALYQFPLTGEERDELTTDELFVLVLVRRLERLTTAEQQKLTSADRKYLAAVGSIYIEAAQVNSPQTKSAGFTTPGGIGEACR
jgi:hypothetical protein